MTTRKAPVWSKRRGTPRWQLPFLGFEFCCEYLSFWLSRWAFVEVLDYAAKFSLLVGIILYVSECDSRKRAAADQFRAKNYQAWQTIATAHGQVGDLGRRQALKDLAYPAGTLHGVDVSGAYLDWLDLPKVSLFGAHFVKAKLQHVNFFKARLDWADLAGADLHRSVLAEANLDHTNLRGANLMEVDLAHLVEATREDPRTWRNISDMERANIKDVKNPPPGFIEFAKSMGAIEVEYDDWTHLVDGSDGFNINVRPQRLPQGAIPTLHPSAPATTKRATTRPEQ